MKAIRRPAENFRAGKPAVNSLNRSAGVIAHSMARWTGEQRPRGRAHSNPCRGPCRLRDSRSPLRRPRSSCYPQRGRNDPDPERQRSAHHLAHEPLRFQRWMRRDFLLTATSGRARDHILERLILGDAAQPARPPLSQVLSGCALHRLTEDAPRLPARTGHHGDVANSSSAPFGRSPPRSVCTRRITSPRFSRPACWKAWKVRDDRSGLDAIRIWPPGTKARCRP